MRADGLQSPPPPRREQQRGYGGADGRPRATDFSVIDVSSPGVYGVEIEYGKLPGVLVVHEWWGLNDYVKGRAVQLANLGYVAFALDMYGAGVLATDPKAARR